MQFGNVTALHMAVIGANANVVSLLLNAGAVPDALDIRGMTPLMWAVATDRPNARIVRLLIERGADVSIRSKADETSELRLRSSLSIWVLSNSRRLDRINMIYKIAIESILLIL